MLVRLAVLPAASRSLPVRTKAKKGMLPSTQRACHNHYNCKPPFRRTAAPGGMQPHVTGQKAAARSGSGVTCNYGCAILRDPYKARRPHTLGTGVAAGSHSKRASGSRARSVPIGVPPTAGEQSEWHILEAGSCCGSLRCQPVPLCRRAVRGKKRGREGS